MSSLFSTRLLVRSASATIKVGRYSSRYPSARLLSPMVLNTNTGSGVAQMRAKSTVAIPPIDPGTVVQDPMTGEFTRLPDIDPGRLVIEMNPDPRPPPPASSLVFGHTFTDHMLTIPWDMLNGWGAPKIQPYGPLSLEPSCTVLHYAQTLFEGMKAYRDERGKVTMFRPDKNMARMNTSAQRIALPTFNGDALLDLIKELVRIDKNWIPQLPGHSLYIRPVLMGTQTTIGISPPSSALLFVICSPVGPYYPQGFKPVSLYGTTEYIRAAPGGTGAYKLGLNYAPGAVAQKSAAHKGYVQNLWLYGPEHHLTEVGTMNLFTVLKTESGALELVTPPLDGMILPGVTRDSVLTLARNHVSSKKRLEGLANDLIVSERPITMAEVQSASSAGRLVEMFGAGTAAVISPIDKIGFQGGDVHVPTGEDGLGPVSRVMWNELLGIQMGTIESDWNVVVSE